MSLALRIEIEGISTDEITQATTDLTAKVSRKWNINSRRLPEGSLQRVPEVVLIQAQNKLRNAGITWVPGQNHVLVALAIPEVSMEDVLISDLVDQIERHGIFTDDDVHSPATEDQDGVDIDAFAEIIKAQILRYLEVATFYAVGALGVLTTSDN